MIERGARAALFAFSLAFFAAHVGNSRFGFWSAPPWPSDLVMLFLLFNALHQGEALIKNREGVLPTRILLSAACILAMIFSFFVTLIVFGVWAAFDRNEDRKWVNDLLVGSFVSGTIGAILVLIVHPAENVIPYYSAIAAYSAAGVIAAAVLRFRFRGRRADGVRSVPDSVAVPSRKIEGEIDALADGCRRLGESEVRIGQGMREGEWQQVPDASRFCETPYSRSAWRLHGFNGWNDVIPPFDERGFLESVMMLPRLARDREHVLWAIRKIVDTFIFPASALCMVLVEQNGPVLYQNDDVVYPVSLDDFEMDNPRSLAWRVLRDGADFFIEDVGNWENTGELPNIYTMPQQPQVGEDGRFPDYVVEPKDSIRHMPCGFLQRDRSLLLQCLMLPIRGGGEVTGFVLLGWGMRICNNQLLPSTRWDFPWFHKIMAQWVSIALQVVEEKFTHPPAPSL
ncbi:MAG TPA: hypothetical protein PKM65_14015 [Spirochaetota bacterium]|nr:hypothetical protein [Spirochaetota bacterium]